MSLGIVNPSLYTNLVDGYTTTATAAGTTTLSYPSSTRQQFFTGTTTQTLRLPVTTTFPANGLGIMYEVVNNSTGIVTVQTGGSVTITTVAASTTVMFRCINVGTDATTSWSFTFPAAGASGTLVGDVTGTLAATNVIAVDGLPINATTGANSSIFFGYSSTVPTATTSVGIGYEALNIASSSVINNVAIGHSALSKLVLAFGASNNTAIGSGAMANANSISSRNVAVGAFSAAAPGGFDASVSIGGHPRNQMTLLRSSISIGLNTLTNYFPYYSTGTASQSGNTVTGVGTTFTPAMINSYIVFGGNLATATGISNFISATVLTVSPSQTIGSTTFEIYPSCRFCVAMGIQAMQDCRSDENVAIGSYSGEFLTESTYSTGTAGTGGVSSLVVTGVGTEWTQLMSNGLIVFAGGAQGTIGLVISLTMMNVNAPVTVANGTAYVIYLRSQGNTLIGTRCGNALSTGYGNSILGFRANCGADATHAIVIGSEAEAGVAAATDAIIIGRSAGNLTATGDGNIGIGTRTFQVATSINRSVAIGVDALSNATGGNGAVAIGWQALKAQNGGSGDNIGIGINAGFSLTSGSSNTIIGYIAGQALTTASGNVVLGYSAAFNATWTGTSNNVMIGNSTGLSQGSGAGQNIGIGTNALRTGNALNNIGIGNHAMAWATTGTQNLAIGRNVFSNLTTGNGNIGLGDNVFSGTTAPSSPGSAAFLNNVTGSNNIAIGKDCCSYNPTGQVYINLAGSNNVSIGAACARYITFNAASNVAIGASACSAGGGSSNTVAIGNNALAGSAFTSGGTVGQSGTTITNSSASFTPEMVGGYVVYWGDSTQNAATGISAYVSTTVLTATTSMTTSASTSHNIFYNLSGSTAVGDNALAATRTGRNTAIGANALNVATAGRYTVGTASQTTTTVTGVGTAWFAQMVGGTIVFSGGQTGLITVFNSVTSLTVSTSQTVGSTTYIIYLPYNGNVGVGYSVGSGVTTGHYNTLMGYSAGSSITTGFNNVCIGFGANTSATVANSISIGRSASATVDGAIALGTVTANVAGGFFCAHRGPISVTFNAAGFIAGTNELVELTSSRRYKQNIRDLEEVTDKFSLLRPVRFNAIEGHGDPQEEHIGLIAEEVEELFPEFVTHDQEGQTTGMMYDRMIALLIKEMKAMKRDYTTQINELRARLA